MRSSPPVRLGIAVDAAVVGAVVSIGRAGTAMVGAESVAGRRAARSLFAAALTLLSADCELWGVQAATIRYTRVAMQVHYVEFNIMNFELRRAFPRSTISMENEFGEVRSVRRADAPRRSQNRRCRDRSGAWALNRLEPGVCEVGFRDRRERSSSRMPSRPCLGPGSGPDCVAGAHRHGGGLGLGACQAVSGDAFGRGTCRSGPCPHLSQTVMSFPIRRIIIAGTVSGSGGSGSGWASSSLHRASLPARQRLASSP